MLVAATTIAALLVASPSASDVDRIAANSGFLLGNAQRCGLDDRRITNAAQLVHQLIAAAAQDEKEEEAATTRFAEFFLVSAFPDKTKESVVASCRVVASELTKLEQHRPTSEAAAAVGSSGLSAPRPGDGE